MRDRPILFSAPLIPRVLDGSKTQTRRLVKFPEWARGHEHLLSSSSPALALMEDGRPRRRMTCPYGQPGDRLWVREGIRRNQPAENGEPKQRSHYIADGAPTVADCWPWKNSALPGIHCPRGLSRIALEITDVRVQRLQEISEGDAQAEGVEPEAYDLSCRASFSVLWDGINGKRASWESNPFVWAISFRRVETSHG